MVFIGHRLEDSNIRDIILRLTKARDSRPRYFLISPKLTAIDARFWESKKVTTLPGTLEDFVTALEHEIPRNIRSLLKHVKVDHPIRKLFRITEELSPAVRGLVEQDVEYVHAGMPEDAGSPRAFYRGFGLRWFPIRSGLDVRRRLVDTLLTDVIVRPDDDRPAVADFYLVKSAAGTGKSVLLRRLAWEAATDADALVLWVRPHGEPEPEALEELHRATGRRLFLIWDDAASNKLAIRRTITFARSRAIPVTVISAERMNEWNMSGNDLSPLVADDFELPRLTKNEIELLVHSLEKHDCLGPNLASKTHEQRIDEFVRVAGRRLLVALHEATTGPPFSDILEDEFSKIRPIKAQKLYLTVCVLNRLRTAVRAGFISRVHDIPFEEFKTELFAPLDHVVEVRVHRASGDYLYQARHPEIAQIVFTRLLSDRDDRLNEYLRIIGNLNLAFDTDRASFRGLLNAHSLRELFPDYQDVRTIFSKAEQVGDKEAYFYQQRANYERLRPDGNFDEAESFIRTARVLNPRDDSIRHTYAAVLRARAEKEDKPLARRKYRRAARSILSDLLEDRRHDEYARVTLVHLGIDDLRDLLSTPQATEREIDDQIRIVDRLISEALQQHSDAQYLLTAEADFSALVSDDARSLAALQRAFEANPRDPYVANRLARSLLNNGDDDEARAVLRTALDGNRGDMRLNFQYGEILRLSGETDVDRLAYHFERAFTPGDRNYEAQFWFARYAFESRDDRLKGRSREVFRSLRTARMGHEARIKVRDLVGGSENPTVFQGSIERLEQTYGRIRRDGPGDLIFVHSTQVDEDLWERLRPGDRACFSIGLCMSGPTAVGLESLGV